MNAKITINPNKRVLVIEDNAKRIEWFRSKLSRSTYATTAAEALTEVRYSDCYDIVFFDYDTGPAYWQPGDSDIDTFIESARALVQNEFEGTIIVHSLNTVGAQRIKNILDTHDNPSRARRSVYVIPYGTFEIVEA